MANLHWHNETLPGLDAYLTREPAMPSVSEIGEEERERDWIDLEREAAYFAAKYGPAAMLRCVARAVEEQ